MREKLDLKKGFNWLWREVIEMLYWLPGGPAFRNCSPEDRRKALMEFLWILGVSLSPLLLIFVVNSAKMQVFSIEGAFSNFSQYIQAGQLYFYVATIMGAVVHLLVVDKFNFKENDGVQKEDQTKQRERGWFFLYLYVCTIVSCGFLSAYHFGVMKANSGWMNWSSFIVYFVSLYFSLVISMYGNMTAPSPENTPSKQRIKEMGQGLEGFSGDDL